MSNSKTGALHVCLKFSLITSLAQGFSARHLWYLGAGKTSLWEEPHLRSIFSGVPVLYPPDASNTLF